MFNKINSTMKAVTFEESRRIQLAILQELDQFCRRNNIRYSLGEGTLIGAVRHKGFIPWDDDIDVIMLRKDYDKFVALYKDGKFSLKTIRKGCDWKDCYSRLSDNTTCVFWDSRPTITEHGLWVAILPIDNMPDDDEMCTVMWKKSKRLQMLCYAKMVKYPFHTKLYAVVKPLVMAYVKCCSAYYFEHKAEKIISQYKNVKTRRMTIMAIWWAKYPLFDAELFSDFFEMEFEGRKFFVIKGYDEYLRGQYGDYMTPPPVENRVPQHHFKAYWKE